LLYALLKIPAALAIWIYTRRLSVNKKTLLNSPGPLMIACNHPNSFLDAIIIATLFRRPVFSLARGDAFGNSFYAKLLRSMNMLPVYRVSEGVENLEHNYKTFDACKKIFEQNGIVLIFSEGRCINEWHLRPLKKGTARLAISSWQDGIPLKVLPAGINYSSFSKFGKNLHLNFGETISAEQVDWKSNNGKSILDFNDLLRNQLKGLVYEIDADNHAAISKKFDLPVPAWKKILLAIPALAGWLIHLPLYLPVRHFARHGIKEEGHYDSIIVGLLFILYPLYLILLAILLALFTSGWWWLPAFIVPPVCAWAYVQIKRQ